MNAKTALEAASRREFRVGDYVELLRLQELSPEVKYTLAVDVGDRGFVTTAELNGLVSVRFDGVGEMFVRAEDLKPLYSINVKASTAEQKATRTSPAVEVTIWPDNEAVLRAALTKAADALDAAWAAVDNEYCVSTDPPDAERIALVAQIEALIDYRFTMRS